MIDHFSSVAVRPSWHACSRQIIITVTAAGGGMGLPCCLAALHLSMEEDAPLSRQCTKRSWSWCNGKLLCSMVKHV